MGRGIVIGIDVKENIDKVIKEVATTQKIKLPVLQDHLEIVDDLGFTSFSVGLLITKLEDLFNVDPFEDEEVMIDDMRTIKGICAVYTNCIEKNNL